MTRAILLRQRDIQVVEGLLQPVLLQMDMIETEGVTPFDSILDIFDLANIYFRRHMVYVYHEQIMTIVHKSSCKAGCL